MKKGIIKAMTGCLMILYLTACSSGSTAEDHSSNSQDSIDSVTIVSGFGQVRPLHDLIRLTAETNGVVDKILKNEGDSVRTNDTLIVLEHKSQRADIEKLIAEIQTQESVIKTAEIKVRLARDQLGNKKTYYQRIKNAFDDNSESKQKLDDAKLAYSQAEINLQSAQSDNETEKKRLKSLHIDLEKSRINLSKYFITAPENGVIYKLDVVQGDPVTAYQVIGDFADYGPLSVKAEIDELYAPLIRKDQQAEIIPYGRNDTIAEGHIVYASPGLRQKSIFSEKPSEFTDRRVREIRVKIDRMKRQVMVGERVNVVVNVKREAE